MKHSGTARTVTRIVLMAARLSGVLALASGVAIWLGQAGALLYVHMGCGVLLALALGSIALAGFRTAPGLTIFALAWCLLLPGLGFAQMIFLPGEHHWLVQAAHLLVGLVALALAERMAGLMRRAAAA